MNKPKLYGWDFDRGRVVPRIVGGTFSVGVYQWLPTASGKRLKKSKTIRVKGYVADPQPVYRKAEELCRRLSSEGVRIEQPPPWLQKRYSVPKPPELVIQRPKDDQTLNAGGFRRIRARVVKELVETQGYIKTTRGWYVKCDGEFIRGFNFQASQWGRKFTVDLGVHYDFLPSFFSLGNADVGALSDLDFWLTTRFGTLNAGHRDEWWPQGDHAQAAESILRLVVPKTLENLDTLAATWRKPEVWLSLIPPSRLRTVARDQPVRPDADENENEEAATARWQMLRALVPHWGYDSLTLSIGLFLIAVHVGDRDAAQAYHEIGVRDVEALDDRYSRYREVWKQFGKQLAALA